MTIELDGMFSDPCHTVLFLFNHFLRHRAAIELETFDGSARNRDSVRSGLTQNVTDAVYNNFYQILGGLSRILGMPSGLSNESELLRAFWKSFP